MLCISTSSSKERNIKQIGEGNTIDNDKDLQHFVSNETVKMVESE